MRDRQGNGLILFHFYLDALLCRTGKKIKAYKPAIGIILLTREDF